LLLAEQSTATSVCTRYKVAAEMGNRKTMSVVGYGGLQLASYRLTVVAIERQFMPVVHAVIQYVSKQG